MPNKPAVPIGKKMVEYARKIAEAGPDKPKNRGGRKPGHPGAGGRPEGSRDKKRIEVDETLEDLTREVVSGLSEEEIMALKPKEVLRLCTLAAVRTHRWTAMLTAATAWAPYEHARLTKNEHSGTLTLEQLVIKATQKKNEASGS